MTVDLGSPSFIIYRSQNSVILERSILFMERAAHYLRTATGEQKGYRERREGMMGSRHFQ